MGFELTCYRLGPYTVPIVPARSKRAIFDRNTHAYRCLPLTVANAAGWELLNPSGFTAEWDGGDSASSLVITPDDPRGPIAAKSHFAFGILTFDTGWLFQTSDAYDLWTMGPPNDPKDGISPLSGIVETRWLPYSFTMNWQFTRPGRIRFEAGEPFCFITPTQIREIQACQPRELNISDHPALQADLIAWTKDRERATTPPADGETPAVRTPWRGFYHRGEQAPGANGPPPVGHVKKLRVKPPVFVGADPSPPAAPPPTPGPPRIVSTHAEAAAAGFLLIEDYLPEDTCRILANAYRANADKLSQVETDPYWRDRLLHLATLDSAAPAAANAMREALQRALPEIAAFYRATRPLYADVVHLVGWREGMSMQVHADNANPDGSPNAHPHRDFSGVLYLNDDYEGGGLDLPRQGVLVRPRRGTLISLPAGLSHMHGVEPVTSGLRITMPFFLTHDRSKAARNLHPSPSGLPASLLTFDHVGKDLVLTTN